MSNTDSVLIVVLFLSCVLFAGDPDLMDALIHRFMECK